MILGKLAPESRSKIRFKEVGGMLPGTKNTTKKRGEERMMSNSRKKTRKTGRQKGGGSFIPVRPTG